MILNTKKLESEKSSLAIVILKSTLPGVYGVYGYDAKDFYLRYYSSGRPGGAKRIHEDIVDTFYNSNENKCGYSKEQLMEFTTLEIINDMNINFIEKA